jgi:Zn-dependent protease with chaperone function
LALAACSTANLPRVQATSTPQPEKHPDRSPAQQREHLRIVAAYGGIYESARLQSLVEKTVDRLVAASERPDLKYQVTILNSPAVNAFALPDGRLYVTRGLIALANDNSELASVMAHEMAHVIARHAAIRSAIAFGSLSLGSCGSLAFRVLDLFGACHFDPRAGALFEDAPHPHAVTRQRLQIQAGGGERALVALRDGDGEVVRPAPPKIDVYGAPAFAD